MNKNDTKDVSLADFQDPKLEGRRIFAETWGTFLAVMVTVSTKVLSVTISQISPDMMCFARGLVVTIIIYFMGSISGAHLNPVVTLGFALRGNFPWKRVPGYLIAQLAGAFLAVLFVRAVFGTQGEMGASVPGKNISVTEAFVTEIILTTGFINTILGTAYEGRNIGANGAIAVGGYITLASFIALYISGASMNPFRSLAPDAVRGNYETTWIYFAAPLIGMLIAVIFEGILRGGPGSEGARIAQGNDGQKL